MADNEKNEKRENTSSWFSSSLLKGDYIVKKAEEVVSNEYLLNKVQNEKTMAEIYTDFTKELKNQRSKNIVGRDLNYYADTFNKIDVDYLKDINKELNLFTDDDIAKIAKQHEVAKKYVDAATNKKNIIAGLGDISENSLKDIEQVYGNIANKGNLDNVAESFKKYKDLKAKLGEAIQNGADESELNKIRKGITKHAEKIAGKNNSEMFNKLYDALGDEGAEKIVTNAVEHASHAAELEKGVKNFLNDQVTSNIDFRKNKILSSLEKANDISEDSLKGRILGDVVTDIGAVAKMSAEQNIGKGIAKFAKKAGKYALGAVAIYGLVQMLHDDKGMDNSQLYNNTPII